MKLSNVQIHETIFLTKRRNEKSLLETGMRQSFRKFEKCLQIAKLKSFDVFETSLLGTPSLLGILFCLAAFGHVN